MTPRCSQSLLFLLCAEAAFLQPVVPSPSRVWYHTEPNHTPITWDLRTLTHNLSLLAPGYYFVAPMKTWNRSMGPRIYGLFGDLVWDAGLTTTLGIANDMTVCDWKGTSGSHICIHDDQLDARVLGNRVFDHTYTQVGLNYTNTGNLGGGYPDSHEFNMLPGGQSFLYPVSMRPPLDLRQYGSVEHGRLLDSCFQETDVDTGEPFFSWCSHQHLDVWESYIFPHVPGHVNLTSAIAGDGTSGQPWDFIHLNAIDKNPEGDYLISARHLDSIIKVSGPSNPNHKPGTVLWRLGGKKNDFDHDFIFSRQHHVRFISSTSTGDTFSVFDNAWEGYGPNPPSANVSSGIIISVNNETMKASVVARYFNPEDRLSGSRGSFYQLSSNSNALAGWGNGVSQFTEYSYTGDVLVHGEFSFKECHNNTCGPHNHQPYSYRVYKDPWIGKPHWSPKLVAYAETCDTAASDFVVYASWNGATEVRKWHLFTSDSDQGPWISAGVYGKSGFETRIVLNAQRWTLGVLINKQALRKKLPTFARVDALGEDGKVLGKATAATFVPAQRDGLFCGGFGCDEGFRYDKTPGRARQCSEFDFGTVNYLHFYATPAILFIPAFAAILACIYRLLYFGSSGMLHCGILQRLYNMACTTKHQLSRNRKRRPATVRVSHIEEVAGLLGSGELR